MSIFERRHYQAIAEELRRFMCSPFTRDTETIKSVARGLAIVFSLDNPNFNREKFLKACGMEGK